MGEARRKALAVRQVVGQDQPPQVVDTLGGRMHVRWDEGAAATPHGQRVFFAEFLAATGVFERWVSSCPLSYRSGNAPDKRDVLGTLMLGLLAGHRRYAHITALRGDAVAAQALGMGKVISEDALRRALERIDEAASAAWTSVTFTAVDSTLGSGLAVGLTITSARQHAFNPRCVNRPSGAGPWAGSHPESARSSHIRRRKSSALTSPPPAIPDSGAVPFSPAAPR